MYQGLFQDLEIHALLSKRGTSQSIGGGKLLNHSLNLLSFLISYSAPVLKSPVFV